MPLFLPITAPPKGLCTIRHLLCDMRAGGELGLDLSFGENPDQALPCAAASMGGSVSTTKGIPMRYILMVSLTSEMGKLGHKETK